MSRDECLIRIKRLHTRLGHNPRSDYGAVLASKDVTAETLQALPTFENFKIN